MKNRLIELIQDAVGGCARNWAEVIADKLISAEMVPPCKPGDEVWINRNFHNTKHPQKGIVSEVNFISYSGKYWFQIVVKYIGRGSWMKDIFPTQEDAQKAIERGKK